jgi:Cu-Zn family superoxide dismutase
MATLKDRSGGEIGEATLRDTPNGVLVSLSLEGAPPGKHALHIHETGQCEPPFRSAGGHFAPDGRSHGFLDPQGPHAGDLPNITVPDTGRLQIEVLAPRVTLTEGAHRLLDADGAALVIHQGADDYRTDPAGAAGERIACGVIR